MLSLIQRPTPSLAASSSPPRATAALGADSSAPLTPSSTGTLLKPSATTARSSSPSPSSFSTATRSSSPPEHPAPDAALPEARLKELYDFATGLGLEVLVETHNLAELEIAHRIGADIIGVNNRNLVTFETDLNTSLELSTHFKDQPVYISESAIFNGADAALVAPYFNGILVGTALMTAGDVAEKVKELQIDKG